MSKNEKSYFYEIELPESLLLELKNFADKWNEDLHICILRTLKEGLKARRKNKELYKKALYCSLEETEEKLRGPL